MYWRDAKCASQNCCIPKIKRKSSPDIQLTVSETSIHGHFFQLSYVVRIEEMQNELWPSRKHWRWWPLFLPLLARERWDSSQEVSSSDLQTGNHPALRETNWGAEKKQVILPFERDFSTQRPHFQPAKMLPLMWQTIPVLVVQKYITLPRDVTWWSIF